MMKVALLVAIMYSTIITISIGSLLGTLALLVKRGVRPKQEGLFLSWLGLLLLVHFSLFWQTAAIMQIDEWHFGGFLFLVIGPVLLFLSANMLVEGVGERGLGELNQHYLDVSRRFLGLLCILITWLMAMGLHLGRENSALWYADIGLIGLALALVVNRNPKAHAMGALIAWLLVLMPGLLSSPAVTS